MAIMKITRISGAITLLITVFSLSLPAYARYSGGTGEPNNPYKIATAEDLMFLGESPEDYYKHFILTADIDLDPNLSGPKVFDRAVIAPYTNRNGHFEGVPFTGVFDGNGHIISHLTITGENYLGLFGVLESAANISNLGLVAIDIDGMNSYVGGLVGYNWDGGIFNCYSTGSVSGNFHIGGLVGFNNIGAIIDSYSTGTVGGYDNVGGLVGYNWEGDILNCYSTGSVSGNYHVGGLVGSHNGSITNSYSTGRVSGDNYVGGLVGANKDTITLSFWDMQTSGQTTSAGGEGLTTAQMQDIDTYLNAGWDFVDESLNGTSDYWQISHGEYPRLRFAGNRPTMPEGLGTDEQPYLIRDAGDLGTICFEPTAHYRIEASIDLSGITWSTAVIPWLGGSFDGNGYTINHLHVQGGNYLGLIGQLQQGATISNLGMVAVEVYGEGNIGGLVGYNKEGLIINSYSNGTITGNGYLGGLVGYNNCDIANSYSTGTVTGNGYLGGLVGCNKANTTNCYSNCIVTGISYSTGRSDSDEYVGGLVGCNWEGSIKNCYSTSRISGDRGLGGLVGYNDGYIISSFWDTQTSEQTTSSGGGGLTTAQMQDINTYLNAGWDFADESLNGTCDYWKISPDEYPMLRFAGDRPVMPEGLGTTEQPYLIRNATDLGTVCFEPTAHYRLEASVDLLGITWSTAVIPWFEGSFDGNGYTINHLNIQGVNYVGLFGRLESEAVISNLGLEGMNVNGTGYYVSGLVGYNSGNVTNSYSIGIVSGDEGDYNEDRNMGGLVGYNEGNITNSYSTGMIRGGFIFDNMGGLVGVNEGSILSSFSAVMIDGGGNVGGLVGYNNGTITSCYCNGTVKGDQRVGGLVGRNQEGSIFNCYSTSRSNRDQGFGGLVGYNKGNITFSFWDTQTSEQTTSAGGEGLNTAQMQDINTYLNVGWDFVDESLNGTSDYWQISPGKYPQLRFAADKMTMTEGLGTTEQPYLIRNATDLKTVCFEPTANYCLEAFIDLSGITWSTAVIPWFGGSFDGNGHTIRHLHIQGVNYLGLFGRLDSEAMIYNLGLEEIDVIGTGFYVGGLVGKINKGSIFSCYCSGTVTGEDHAGGLVGLNYGKISNCYRTGTAIGHEHVAGCVGTNWGEVTNCYSAVRIGEDGQISIVVGYNHKIVTGCFWDIEICELSSGPLRMGLTTAEMQTASTFLEAGWDFVGEIVNGTEDIWWINEGRDYPRLWWEAAEQ